nr:MAG TPA: hypothetical protein [Caudoviricetes sp.]
MQHFRSIHLLNCSHYSHLLFSTKGKRCSQIGMFSMFLSDFNYKFSYFSPSGIKSVFPYEYG